MHGQEVKKINNGDCQQGYPAFLWANSQNNEKAENESKSLQRRHHLNPGAAGSFWG